MAVFEKKKSVLALDDTVPLQCTIEAAQNVETHIVSISTVIFVRKDLLNNKQPLTSLT